MEINSYYRILERFLDGTISPKEELLLKNIEAFMEKNTNEPKDIDEIHTETYDKITKLLSNLEDTIS